MIGIAHHTGWSEHFILWELPLARGMQYQHAIAYANGAKVMQSEEGAEDEMEAIRRTLTNG